MVLGRHQHTLLGLSLLLAPLMVNANNGAFDASTFTFHQNWQGSTEDIFQSYQERNQFNSVSLFDSIVKDNALKFETASIESGKLYFDYPDNMNMPQSEDMAEKSQPYAFQGLHVYKLIPKDLMPYLGLRMRYNITTNFGLINDITTKNIFYGLTYSY